MAFNDIGNRFQRTTPAVLNLIIANVIVFLAEILLQGNIAGKSFDDLFALHHYRSDEFQPWQFLTHMFMHAGFPHILFNMFALWMFGSTIERVWGPKKFLIFYFICGLGAAVIQMAHYTYMNWNYDHMAMDAELMSAYQFYLKQNATVGASGAIMGVVAAFGYLFPNTQMIIMPIPVPIKAKWAVIGIIVLDVFSGIAGRPGDNVAHWAHVGGALTGFLIVLFWNRKNRATFY